jgi:hypothetical protein
MSSAISELVDCKKHVFLTTGLSFLEMFYYWLLGAGLPLVLFCLLFCLHRQCKKEFFCLHRQCKKESGSILKESLTSPLQILEENIPNGNQRISVIEMDDISLYESINENKVLSNLSLAMQSNGKTVSCQLKRSQSTSSEIADDILVNAYREDQLVLVLWYLMGFRRYDCLCSHICACPKPELGFATSCHVMVILLCSMSERLLFFW